MVKAFGLVYLTEEEMENEKLRKKYPDALLARPYTMLYGTGKFTHEVTFTSSGYNRKERRALANKRKYNTRGFPSGYNANTVHKYWE
jgi:hypothetical protein